MANSKKHNGHRRSPEKGQGRQQPRPTRFKLSEEYRSSLRGLGTVVQARLVDRGLAFRRDWLKPDITDEALNRRWGYKPLKGAPEGLKVMQVEALEDYRVSLLVITKGNPGVWLLRAYPRQTNNQRDYERSFEAAKRISEEEQ